MRDNEISVLEYNVTHVPKNRTAENEKKRPNLEVFCLGVGLQTLKKTTQGIQTVAAVVTTVDLAMFTQ